MSERDPRAVAETAQPRLSPGVRLQFDANRQAWLLLAPERIIETEGPTHEILSRCDGKRTVGQIVDELARMYAADRAAITADVSELLGELAAKRVIAL
ncbi:MAG: pyrroloquinoline quinone biosynthesis peptide chaperone PqqD [Pseudomonadota bacterium]|nr:pyrroloquinoline quinone biosynthesis peptide chaperone PqqD [Pseudomonadota bacterium]